MNAIRRSLTATLAVGALAAPTLALVAPAHEARAASRPLVAAFTEPGFGKVLGTRTQQALYYWNQEKKGQIRCTGACAVAWPPLYVPKGATVPAKVAGVKGTFGVIRRPDGRRQVTHNGRAIYTYVNEGPGVVLCDDVDGWFVVRV